MASFGNISSMEITGAVATTLKQEEQSGVSHTALVVVRNTFIDVYTPPQRKRCQSMPPTIGSAVTAMAACLQLLPPPSKEDLSKPSAGGDASTDASSALGGSPRGGEAAQDAYDLDDRFLLESEPSSPASTPTWRPASPPPVASAEHGEPAEPPPPPSPCEGPVRSPLNARAKLWSPAAAMAVPAIPANPGTRLLHFTAETQRVLEGVLASVRRVEGCMAAEMCWEHAPGRTARCTLLAQLAPGQQHQRSHTEGRLLAAAEAAVAAAVERAAGVALLGAQQAPFRREPGGFGAVLGELHDETRACWSMYATGFCKRKGACRWKHPQASVAFQFSVVAAPTPPACVVLVPVHLQQAPRS